MTQLVKSILQILNHPNNKSRKIHTAIKLLWWKINQLVFKKPAIVTLRGPVKIFCYPDSSYGSLIFYTQYPEYYEMKILEHFLKENSVFIDVGAGFGDYSLLAGSIITSGRIFAFEPLQKERGRLRENVRLNKLEKLIRVEPLAVSDSNGTAQFVSENISELSHLQRRKILKIEKTISVETITLDDFIHDNKIKNIDAIKIDVEGAESFVLKGARKTLSSQKINFLIVEFNRNQTLYGNSKFNSLQYLKECGYIVYTIDTGKLLPADDLDRHKTQNAIIILNNPRTIKRFHQAIQGLGFKT